MDKANAAIELARKHLNNGAVMGSSAKLCLMDALKCWDKGKYSNAHAHAVKSLAYSVGIFHADYKSAA